MFKDSDINIIEITPFEASIDMEKGSLLIDVRTKNEHNQIKIKNSINISINSDIFNEQIDKLNKTKEYIVHCMYGKRGSKACKILQKKGFKVKNLKGGLDAWINDDLDIEKRKLGKYEINK